MEVAMTKTNERETETNDLIDLGDARVETKGAQPVNQTDGSLAQYIFQPGIQAD